MTFRKIKKKRINDAQWSWSPFLALLFIAKVTAAIDQNEDGEACLRKYVTLARKLFSWQ